MAKLRLSINSTDVLGVYGIVDIVFNGVTLAASKQLSTTVESLEYDVEILTSSNNVLKISLLNSQAYDNNNDGYFTEPEDSILCAVVSSLSYAVDGVNFITLIPQAATSYTVPSGPKAGSVVLLTENVTRFMSYNELCAITFNSDGIVDTEYCNGVNRKILPNGHILIIRSGQIWDGNGNRVS